ncbi:MAG: hypothetical protein D6719_10030, partial [Candidatus Dadabacteria bacterium]
MTTEELNNAGKHLEEIRNRTLEGYRLAAGILYLDRHRLLLLYLLIIIPALVGVWLGSSDPSVFMYLTLAERVLQLIFFYLVTDYWISQLRKHSVREGSFISFFITGMAFWLIFAVPAGLGFFLNVPQLVKFLSVLGLIAAIYLGFKYFFYFFPLIAGERNWRIAFRIAQDIVQQDWLLPVKAQLAPFGFMSLAVIITTLPSPDGREVFFDYLSAIVSGVSWLLSSYLSLAFAMEHLSEKSWRDYGLDPYRRGRLATLSVQGPDWLTSILRPRAGLLMLGFSVILFNIHQVIWRSTPPTPEITVQSIEVSDKKITLHLHLRDERHHFRGFRPINFNLAGKSGKVISNYPEAAYFDSREEDYRFIFPQGDTEVTLTLEFKLDRSRDDILSLEDLYLWYRRARLLHLDLPALEGGSRSSPVEEGFQEGKKQKVRNKKGKKKGKT